MKVLIAVLAIIFPSVSNAVSWDFIRSHYEGVQNTEQTKPTKNVARVNAYAVNQEKLDMYRAAHPRFRFPAKIKDLNEKQAEQILSYFWDNYRFSDYKYDEIQKRSGI